MESLKMAFPGNPGFWSPRINIRDRREFSLLVRRKHAEPEDA
jgi:hypothetical protein